MAEPRFVRLNFGGESEKGHIIPVKSILHIELHIAGNTGIIEIRVKSSEVHGQIDKIEHKGEANVVRRIYERLLTTIGTDSIF